MGGTLKYYSLKLTDHIDADIVSILEKQENKQRYIKNAIRYYIEHEESMQKYYVTLVSNKNGFDSEIHEYSTVLDTLAIKRARELWSHMTKRDKESTRVEVRVYKGDIEADDAPDSAFDYDIVDWSEADE